MLTMIKGGSKIRILYLHNSSEISGGERSLLNLWKNLDCDRFELFLILPEKGPLSQEAQKLVLRVSFLKIPKLHIVNGLPLLKVGFQLGWYLVQNNIQIIHSYSPRNNVLSAIVGRFLGVKVIWHERNLIYGDEKDISLIKTISREIKKF